MNSKNSLTQVSWRFFLFLEYLHPPRGCKLVGSVSLIRDRGVVLIPTTVSPEGDSEHVREGRDVREGAYPVWPGATRGINYTSHGTRISGDGGLEHPETQTDGSWGDTLELPSSVGYW